MVISPNAGTIAVSNRSDAGISVLDAELGNHPGIGKQMLFDLVENYDCPTFRECLRIVQSFRFVLV
jgi:hypothetical protein